MRLGFHTLRYAAIVWACLIVLAPTTSANDLVKREVLKRFDVSENDKLEVIVTRIDIAPGATIPRHSHPGDEIVYVVKGGIVSVPGKPPIEFKVGQTILFPRGKVHGGFTVTGTQTIQAITTHIVDKGQPVTIPAK